MAEEREIVTQDEQEAGDNSIDMNRLKKFATLYREAQKIKKQQDDVKKELAEIERQVLDDFERCGIQNMNVDGFTIYMHTQTWASAKDGDMQRAVEVFKEHGLDDFVKEVFNTQSVSSWVRERLAEKDEALEAGDLEAAKNADIPEEIKEVLHIVDKHSVRARKA